MRTKGKLEYVNLCTEKQDFQSLSENRCSTMEEEEFNPHIILKRFQDLIFPYFPANLWSATKVYGHIIHSLNWFQALCPPPPLNFCMKLWMKQRETYGSMYACDCRWLDIHWICASWGKPRKRGKERLKKLERDRQWSVMIGETESKWSKNCGPEKKRCIFIYTFPVWI